MREFPETASADKLQIEDSELIAVLGTLNKLAEELNLLVGKTISREYWALLAVKDFSSHHPRSFMQKDRLQGHLEGYAFHLYRPLYLTKEEIAGAIDKHIA